MSRHRAPVDQVGYDSDRDELLGMIRALQNRCSALEAANAKSQTTTTTPQTTVTTSSVVIPPAPAPSLAQSPNTVYAGPASGAASDTPAFRALVALDIPALPASQITSGTMATARLGSGTANANTLLHGDSTWGGVQTGDLPASGVTPGTYATGAKLTPVTGNDGSITIDATGRVTAISPAT